MTPDILVCTVLITVQKYPGVLSTFDTKKFPQKILVSQIVSLQKFLEECDMLLKGKSPIWPGVFAWGKQCEMRNSHITALLREEISTSYIEIVITATYNKRFVLALKFVYPVYGTLLSQSLNLITNHL